MGENRELVVEVALAPNDVYTPLLWSRGNLARWVSAFILSLIFYDLYKNESATLLSFPDGESILAVAALLMLFVLLALLVFPYLRVRAMFRKSPGIGKTRRYTFRAAGVTIHSEVSDSDCKWSLFQRVFETPRVFIFSQISSAGTYIPKRCFSSPNDVAIMRALIRENMPGKFRLRSD
jgi:YcxB-like protein